MARRGGKMNRAEAFNKDNDFLVQFSSEEDAWVVIGDVTKFVYERVSNKFLANREAQRLITNKEKSKK